MDSNQPQVRVFEAEGCVQCWATHRALDAAGIAYEVVRVDGRPEVVDELKAMGFAQLPVVQAEGMNPFSGFRPDKLDELKARA